MNQINYIEIRIDAMEEDIKKITESICRMEKKLDKLDVLTTGQSEINNARLDELEAVADANIFVVEMMKGSES